MKLSVSLEIFTWSLFPRISALAGEGISSGKSCDLCYPGGQKSKSQCSHLVLSLIPPRGSDTMCAPSSAAAASTGGGLSKTGCSRSTSAVLFVHYQLR